jgi:hypothetical protein
VGKGWRGKERGRRLPEGRDLLEGDEMGNTWWVPGLVGQRKRMNPTLAKVFPGQKTAFYVV